MINLILFYLVLLTCEAWEKLMRKKARENKFFTWWNFSAFSQAKKNEKIFHVRAAERWKKFLSSCTYLSWVEALQLCFYFSFPKKLFKYITKRQKSVRVSIARNRKPHSHTYRMFINFSSTFSLSSPIFYSIHQFTWRHTENRVILCLMLIRLGTRFLHASVEILME